MPIVPKPFLTVPFADEATPFDVTLAVPATAEDLVSVPGSKKGRIVSLVNEGPGAAAIVFDATATASDILLEEGDTYDEHDLEFVTKISFINVTPAVSPRLRGVIWSGD